MLSDRLRYGGEPDKPSYPLQWPSDVDEFHPRVTQTPLPMALQEVVGYFDAMRIALVATGGQLALSSEVAMVRDKLTLQLPRDQTLFTFLNTTYYPLKYAEARRMMDYQNRVFQAYAAQYGLPFFDKAAVSPLDPELFTDAVHMTPPGLRFQSWIYLQWLAAWLDTEIAHRRLPRPMQHPQSVHPGFKTPGYPLVSKDKILAMCP